jgi:uncharacterized protein (TIGR00369 family)
MTAESGLPLARSVLDAQPFNAVVGAEITVFDDGVAVLRLPIEDRHRQQYGLVHGGVYAYLADNALTFAAGSVLGASVLTTGFVIDYVHGARDGVLEARARVVHHDRGRAVCQVEIHVLDETGSQALCAVAQGTIVTTGARDGG